MLRNKEGKSKKDLRAAEGNCTRGCLSWGKCVEIFQWHPRSSFWTLGCALSLQDLLNTNKLIYWWCRGFPINVYWTVYHIYQNDIQIPSKFVVISIHKMPRKCWRCLRETHWTMVRFSSLFYRKQLCLHWCNLYQILNIYIKYIYCESVPSNKTHAQLFLAKQPHIRPGTVKMSHLRSHLNHRRKTEVQTHPPLPSSPQSSGWSSRTILRDTYTFCILQKPLVGFFFPKILQELLSVSQDRVHVCPVLHCKVQGSGTKQEWLGQAGEMLWHNHSHQGFAGTLRVSTETPNPSSSTLGSGG